MPASLRINSIRIALNYATPFHTVIQVNLLRDYIEAFVTMEPLSGPKAMILVFPTIPLPLMGVYIDQVQKELKQVIANYHLHNNTPGFRNSDWYSLRTPDPILKLSNSPKESK